MQYEKENDLQATVETTVRTFVETDLNRQLQGQRFLFRQPLREWFTGTRAAILRLKKDDEKHYKHTIDLLVDKLPELKNIIETLESYSWHERFTTSIVSVSEPLPEEINEEQQTSHLNSADGDLLYVKTGESIKKQQTEWGRYLMSQFSDLKAQVEIARYGFLVSEAKDEIMGYAHQFFRDSLYVPIENGELINHAVSISNSSALDCQVVAEIFIPATVDDAKVKEIARRTVYSSSFNYLNKPVVIIVLNEMHNQKFVMKLRVKAYVLDIRYEFMFKNDITEMIPKECNYQGIIPQGSDNAKLQLAETGFSEKYVQSQST